MSFEVIDDRRSRVSAWNPTLVLDGAPLPSDSFIRDFLIGRASYVADSLEQALLLPQDMAELRNLEKHEVLLTLKRDLALVISHSQAPNPHLYYFFFFIFC